jgi:DNA invertase Pin-like site-specific DNA recombinase
MCGRAVMMTRKNRLLNNKNRQVSNSPKPNKLQYEIYEDIGKSGFKLSDDENDLFKNRPSFSRMIDDIKSGKIDMVWEWEASRTARNNYGGAYVLYLFEKYNVRYFIKDKEFDLKDPQQQMLRGILTSIAQYERHLITNRTTRGLHNAIDKGRRGYPLLYGYKKTGKNLEGKIIWEPVKSELEKIKFIYTRILEGKSIYKIAVELSRTKEFRGLRVSWQTRTWIRRIQHFEYTGNALTSEGLELLHKYKRLEIENLSVLNDPKYYVKSQPYPEQIVSVADWVTIMTKLYIYKQVYHNKAKTKRAETAIATGLIECPDCGLKYYSYYKQYKSVKTGKKTYFHYYKHLSAIQNQKCEQKPKSILVRKADEIFKIFYFYYYLVFDNTQELIQETLQDIKMKQLETNDKIKSLEIELKQKENNANKFNLALEKTDDIDRIGVLADRISKVEKEIEEKSELLSKKMIELEILNDTYSGTELNNAYYNSVDKINDFFKKLNIEEQRNELARIVKKHCYFYSEYIVIDTGKTIFIFDSRIEYKFDISFLEYLEFSEYFKWYFFEMGEISKDMTKWINSVEITAELMDKFYFAMNKIRVFNKQFLIVNFKTKEDGKQLKTLDLFNNPCMI